MNATDLRKLGFSKFKPFNIKVTYVSKIQSCYNSNKIGRN